MTARTPRRDFASDSEAKTDRVTVTIVGDAVALGALAEEWDALFRACARPSLCALHGWVVAWWAAFGGEPRGAGRAAAPFVVLVRSGEGTLMAVFPLYEERPPRGSLRLSRLRGMGFLGREFADDMTEEPTGLVLPGWEARALAALAAALRERRGRWDLIVLRHLENGPSSTLGAALGRLKSGLIAFHDRATGPYATALPESWAAYRKLLTKSMRDNLGYYPRLLTRDGHDWHVRTRRLPCEVADAVPALIELHRARAAQSRGLEHHNHLEGPVQARFLGTLLTGLAAEGRAFVAELVLDGEVVASQAFVEDGETLMVYYSGYREAWYRYSPIFVIDAIVFREALERGVRRLDFLRVAAPWKARWGAVDCAPMDRAFVVSLRPASLLRLALHYVSVTIRMDVIDRVPVILERARGRLRQKA